MILLGAMAGTLLGEVLLFTLPDGVVKDFFVMAWEPSFGPGTINLLIFSVTFGFTLKVNLVGAIGVGIAIYVLRWY